MNATTHVVTTLAGNGSIGFKGDGIAATSASLNSPNGVAVDGQGNVYIADTDNQRIREVNATTHVITTVAGNGNAGFNGDGIAATSASLYYPFGVAVDGQGNVYIADQLNQRIREVNATTHVITTVAGNGNTGFNGDGIAATSASLYYPSGVALDVQGNLYIADLFNQAIRELYGRSTQVLTAANGFTFEIQTSGAGSGQLLNGPVSPFDGANRLQVEGNDFAPTDDASLTDDGCTVSSGTDDLSGLTVQRRVFVPSVGSQDFARTVDSFGNSSDAAITATIHVVGNLGSDAATRIFTTSSGDAILTPDDLWFGTDGGPGTTALVHVFRGPAGLKPTACRCDRR